MRKADCHPEVRHYAHGYCAACYRKYVRGRAYDGEAISGSYKPASCHPYRKHYAKGLCCTCYWRSQYKLDGDKRERKLAYQREYSKSKSKMQRRASWLRQAHGIALEDYEVWYNNQNGVCYLCHNPSMDGRSLAVDHDHTTNEIRGLLDRTCNTTLGIIEKRGPEWIANVVKYLHWEDEVKRHLGVL